MKGNRKEEKYEVQRWTCRQVKGSRVRRRHPKGETKESMIKQGCHADRRRGLHN